MATLTVSGAKSFVGNTNQGVSIFSCIIKVTGLSQNASNTFSLTTDGTNTGTPLLGPGSSLQHVPNYVPNDISNLGAWCEAADPTTDTAAVPNIKLALKIASGGPTSFRIGIFYGVK